MVVKKKIESLLTYIESGVGAVERWWIGLGLSKKTDAFLKAIGIFIGYNALVFGIASLIALVFTSPIGQWLELNKLNRPYVPGTIYVMQFIPLAIAYLYYRDKIKRG